MHYTTLVTTDQLADLIGNPLAVIIDCRFAMADTSQGYRAYHNGHIPGALYANLDEDLSAKPIAGRSGRHPLPDPTVLAHTLSNWGVAADIQLIAYDETTGPMASRLWWLARWLGHERVAVLDGGISRWMADGRELSRGNPETSTPRDFHPHAGSAPVIDTEQIQRNLPQFAGRLVDSRAPKRYRGEVEPIDPVAGRIPGAVNAPHTSVVQPDGTLRQPEQLRAHFTRIIGEVEPSEIIFYCGSGVSAARNILAFVHAGMGEPCLYPGSWSEWIADRDRPVATGEPSPST